MIARWAAYLDAGVTGRGVGLARILMGLAVLALALEEAVTLTGVLDGAALRLPLSGLVPHLPVGVVSAYFLTWCAMALLFTIGWHARLAGGLLVVILAYPLLLDEQTYSNHLYLALLTVLLLTLADPGSRLSVDARLGRGQRVSLWWPVWLAKCQLSIVYFYAAVSKINGHYLSGDILADNLTAPSLVRLPHALLEDDVLRWLSVAAIVAELFLAVAFWSRRLRMPASVIGVLFHLGLIVVFPAGLALELVAFALTMFALYALAWTTRSDRGDQTSAPSSQGSRGVRGIEKTR